MLRTGVPLEDVDISGLKVDFSKKAAAFLNEADARIQARYGSVAGDAKRGFIASDYEATYAALRRISQGGLCEGRLFIK